MPEAIPTLTSQLPLHGPRSRRDADFSLMAGLFPIVHRPHVRALGAFLRFADAIVTSAALTRAEKIARLEILDNALKGVGSPTWSREAALVTEAFRASLRETGVSPNHARTILLALRRDVAGITYRTWDDLMAYCMEAAAPIGRHMLDLVGADTDVCGPATDALCAALHILKRLRDFRDPGRSAGPLYIPEQFLEDALVSPYHLRAASAKGQTRAVIDRVLDGIDALLAQATPLPALIHSRALRIHTSVILCRATKLAARFRAQDPLQERVGLSRWERASCTVSVYLQSLSLNWLLGHRA